MFPYLYLLIPLILGPSAFLLGRELFRPLGKRWFSPILAVFSVALLTPVAGMMLDTLMKEYAPGQISQVAFGTVLICIGAVGLAHTIYRRSTPTFEVFEAAFSNGGLLIGFIIVLAPALQPLVARFFEAVKAYLHI